MLSLRRAGGPHSALRAGHGEVPPIAAEVLWGNMGGISFSTDLLFEYGADLLFDGEEKSKTMNNVSQVHFSLITLDGERNTSSGSSSMVLMFDFLTE